MVLIKIPLGPDSRIEIYNVSALNNENSESETVIGYVRVSDPKQAEGGESIKSQRQNIISNCKYKKFNLYAIYYDEGISGKNIENRLAFMELMKDIDRLAAEPSNFNKINIYCCYLSRFTRNKIDGELLRTKLVNLGVKLVCFDANIDFSTGTGEFIFSSMVNIAEHQRKQISENTKNVMRQLSEDGKLVTKPKYGYDLVKEDNSKKNVLIENEREQKCIEKLIEIYENNLDLKISYLTNLMNTYKDYYYREKSKNWTWQRVQRIIYDYNLKKRVITDPIPVHLKEQKIKQVIIEMIESGELEHSTSYYIAKKIDEKCLFNHRVTDQIVNKILSTISKKLLAKIKRN